MGVEPLLVQDHRGKQGGFLALREVVCGLPRLLLPRQPRLQVRVPLVDLRLALEALIFKLLLKAPGHFRQLNIFDVLDLRLYQVELSRVVLVALLAAV